MFLQDQDKIQKFVIWAALVALQFDKPCEQTNDTFLSKRLHWLPASVILARPSRQLGVEESKHNLKKHITRNIAIFSGDRMVSKSDDIGF